jgi:hypothetical protein
MKKIIHSIILVFICFACKKETKLDYRVGDLTKVDYLSTYKEYKLWDVNQFRSLDSLIDFIESSGGGNAYLLSYDFENQQIDFVSKEKSTLPVWLGNFDLHRTNLTIYIRSDNTHIIRNQDDFTKATIKKWVFAHILNYGLDPTLSDSPEKAVFSLMLEKGQPITDANKVIYQIVEAYEQLLFEKASLENISTNKAREKYPLNLFISVDSHR